MDKLEVGSDGWMSVERDLKFLSQFKSTILATMTSASLMQGDYAPALEVCRFLRCTTPPLLPLAYPELSVTNHEKPHPLGTQHMCTMAEQVAASDAWQADMCAVTHILIAQLAVATGNASVGIRHLEASLVCPRPKWIFADCLRLVLRAHRFCNNTESR